MKHGLKKISKICEEAVNRGISGRVEHIQIRGLPDLITNLFNSFGVFP
jgi:hypothetical protein